MKVPRAIALPIVLTVCALTLLTATVCTFITFFESRQLEHLSNPKHKHNTPGMTNSPLEGSNSDAKSERYGTLPWITRLYFQWFRIGFLVPVSSLIGGYFLLRSSECSMAALTWFVCLSGLATILWPTFCFLAVHLGFIAFTYYW